MMPLITLSRQLNKLMVLVRVGFSILHITLFDVHIKHFDVLLF